ncbi:MAG: hypothetical protein E5W82_10545 [Mesorhizobium sp.]|nr:MAG: hypothetical protein E5W82_10545 [Mesorhizobium sp.]
MLLKLLARIEPDREYARHGYSQVALYRDLAALPVAVYPFHFESKPRRNQRRVTHNCFLYDLEWLPDLIGPPVHVGALRLRALRGKVAA